jgi:FAD/FMN-containing dehydrogenase
MGTPSPAAIADLAACMRGQVVAPGDPYYPAVRALWNARIATRPALIALCQDAEDVATGLAFARAQGLRTVVRGGGHHVGGSASIEGGLVLDLSAMRSVVVDASARTCTVGGGATWRDVDLATQAFGLAVPGGTVSTTGVGGLTLGGGLGWLRRRFGLTCDHLTAATLVTASGHVRRANASTEADLIWALRGGGGNFGVVTEFVFQLQTLGPLVAHAEVYYEPTEAKSALLALCSHMRDAEEHVAPLAILGRPPLHAPIEADAGGGPTLTVLAVYAGEVDVGMQALQPLRTLAAPACDLSGVSPYTSVQSAFDAEFPAGDRYASRSLVVEDLSEDVVDVLIGVASPPDSPRATVTIWFQGGAMGRVPADASAYPRREAPFLVNLETGWSDPAEDAVHERWLRSAIAALGRHTDGSGYANFAGDGQPDTSVRRLHPKALARLQAVKRDLDPDDVFHAVPDLRAPLGRR